MPKSERLRVTAPCGAAVPDEGNNVGWARRVLLDDRTRAGTNSRTDRIALFCSSLRFRGTPVKLLKFRPESKHSQGGGEGVKLSPPERSILRTLWSPLSAAALTLAF